MKTIQITINEPLLMQVNNAIKELGMSRSAFIRDALQQALRQLEITKLERKHKIGYARHPIELGEFDIWEAEQSWEQI